MINQLLEDIKHYRQLQRAKKNLDGRMKKLQDKIRKQTVGQKTTKVGRYSVYWGEINSSAISVMQAKRYLSVRQFELLIRRSIYNAFTVKYK